MRILLVDDDELLAQTLTHFLTSQQYVVDVARDGEAGWDYAQMVPYDLIVLDINLPKLDGVSLCQKLRQSQCTSPILLLTARGQSADKVIGLDAGADDYLVKPCTKEELSARIRALLRRQNIAATPQLTWGNLSLDPSSCEVTYNGQLVALSPKEYALLELFLRHPQRVFSTNSILEKLWGFDAPGEETVRTLIKRLRQKLKSGGAADVIDTVYGIGYRLKPVNDSANSTQLEAQVKTSTANQARAAAIALWEQFKPPILERLLSLQQAVALLKLGTLTEELRQTAISNAHKLIGSLGMFGFPEGSQLAQAIEQWLQTNVEQVEVAQLQALVTALQQELEKLPQLSDDDLLTSLSEAEDASTAEIQLLSPHLQVAPVSTIEQSLRPTPLSPVKVLVVDDDRLLLKALQQCLPQWGIQVSTLSEPTQLWDGLASERPDLLVLDVDMPQINGMTLCQAIRKEKDWNGLPILFLTAHRDSDIILQLYSAGADDYVAKPFTERELVIRIFNRLERHQQSRTWQKPLL
jgi:DNA-binding response OmpR family regulator/HPt (histidine-containing phosphotransfer) domain-containing protein